MNGPLQIAQADTSGTGGTKQQPRIVKVTKPYGDQSVVVPLSYDGSVKADLSAIASEKITLVHVGEKLIILFDNHSTITLEPFFDSTGKPLQDLTVEVAPGRDITSAEFATLFPVTDDQSVLPAAGSGNGGGAQASGANFTTVGVDPLALGNPLPLLGQEELSGFTITNLLAENNPGVTPSAGFSLSGEGVVEDETTGVQSADGANDQPGLPPFTAPAGTDPLIGWAQSHGPIVGASTANFGTAGTGTVTYALTDLGGQAFNGTDSGLKATVSGNEIFLYTTADGLVVGREGTSAVANPDGKVVFALYLEPGSLKLDVAQYEAISHPDTNNPNDSVNLGSLVHVTQTVTGADSEVATATSAAISISFLDDGPTIEVTRSEGRSEGNGDQLAPHLALSLDESIGGDSGANGAPDGTKDDVAGNTTPDPTGLHPFGEVKTLAGEGDSLGQLEALFNVVKNPGADGEKSTVYAYTFNLQGAGGSQEGGEGQGQQGVATTLKVTDATGHNYSDDTIYLFQVSPTEIIGHVGNDPEGAIAIRITLTNPDSLSGAQLVVDQYMAIDHGDDLNNFDSVQFLKLFGGEEGQASLSLGITLTATITDNDGDQASSSSTIVIADNDPSSQTSIVSFQDDGPTLTVTPHDFAQNSFFFDGFTENNAWGTGSGINMSGNAGGWAIADANDGHGGSDLISNTGSGAVQLERVGDGYNGGGAGNVMHSSTHGFMVDMDASARDLKISQTINGLNPGESYALTFEAGAPFPNQAHLEVWFGGAKVFDLAPTGTMQTYTVELFGNSGDHSNLLEFRETGTPDNQGTYLANIKMADVIVIDETPGVDPDSNDTDSATVAALFGVVVNVGVDTDMASPQFATGKAAAFDVVADFGTEGPSGGTAATGTSFALSVAAPQNGLVDSGLATTEGKEIYLFSENGGTIIVGRVDGAQGEAAFAFTIDSHTGVISIAQYVSLHHPLTTSNDEGIYLNSGVLSATVTVTDGDGDYASQSTDIAGMIRFEDDGPSVTGSDTTLPTLVVDESFLAADGNNPDAGSDQPPAGSTTAHASFTGLFDETFGADGPQGADATAAMSYALGLTGAVTTVDGVSGVASGVTDTLTGHEVMLNLVGGVIEGTVLDGVTVRTVFTITGASDGTITLQQDRAVVHDKPNDPDEANDPTVLDLADGAAITLTATATDGDGDHASQSVDVSGAFQFKDDGPTLSVAIHEVIGSNLIVNGDFEEGHTDLAGADWSIYASLPGGEPIGTPGVWTYGADHIPFEVQTGGAGGVPGDSTAVVELDGDTQGNGHQGQPTPNPDHTNATIQQVIAGTADGQDYQLTFWYAPRPDHGAGDDSGLNVLWNGQVVYTIDSSNMPAGWQQITVHVVGTGPNNTLGFQGVGAEDEFGALLDNVSLQAVTLPRIVIDETPDIQPGTNETTDTTIVGLFSGVQHLGVDPDMAAQYATGGADVLNVSVNFGADGPFHGSAQEAAVYSLSLGTAGQNGLVDSGLTTTDGHHIYLFNEGNGVIVGRIDGDGGGVVAGGSAADVAAFAIAIDQTTGVVSVAQYLSLNNPITTDSNDPVFLKTGALSAMVTVTDGDGDHVSKSADIGALIEFKDDGPTLTGRGTTAAVNEANIYTLLSHGTDPDFLAHTDLLGAAYAAGSLSGAVNPGADGLGSFSFTANAASQLETLHLSSKGEALSYTIHDGVLVGYVDHGQAGLSLGDRPVFTLTLTSNGNYNFELFDQLDHDKPASGADTNTTLQDNGQNSATDAINFGQIIQVTDGDGDHVTLDGAFSVSIKDDIPKIISFDATGKTVTIDETAGQQGNDTTSSTIAHQFVDVAHVGQDHDMGDAPQFAFNNSAIVKWLYVSGADDSAHAVLSLTIAHDGVDSNLTTTDGHHIYLFNENGIIVGRIDGDGGGVAKFGSTADVAAFAISIGQDGKISVAQYLSIHNDNPNNPNDTMTLGSAISAQLSVTDNDGDTVTRSVEIGNTIHFNDDGPKVVGGETAPYHADEGDIVTSRSLGTSPNDGNGDGSYTGSPADNLLGPAVVSGSVAGSVNFGADGKGGFSFASDASSTLQALGLTSKGGTIHYAMNGDTLTAYVDQFGSNGHLDSYDRTVFTLKVDGTTGDFQFKLFDQLDHVDDGTNTKNTELQGGNHTSVAGLEFGSLIVATDGDGDTVTLDGKLTITITDDIPVVTLAATGATVTIDESAGQQGNDASGLGAFLLGVQFGGLQHVGHDPDMGNAPQYAFNALPVVAGAFLPGADDSAHAVLSLTIAHDGVDSNLTTTDGHHIYLFNENGIIVGRIDGDGGGVAKFGSTADVAAFAVAIDALGEVSVAQYLSIHNDNPNNPNDTMTLGSAISAQLAVTDNDGDTVTKSVEIGNAIHFNDDGPTLTVTAPAAINGFDFGAFAVNNFWGTGSGVATGSNGSWTIADADDGHSANPIGNTGSGGVELQRVGDGYLGMHSSTNGFMVDLDASPRDIKISQLVTGLVDGQHYDLRFEAGAAIQGSKHLEVWFGGQLIADIAPDSQMTAYDIQLIGGSGPNHDNLLEFRETGVPDNYGTYLANVSVGEIVIDETAGYQNGTNEPTTVAAETALAGLFTDIAQPGSDGHMSVQYAAGISAVVNVTADFGADGPSTTHATVYSLKTTDQTDSGLQTTSGQHIYLFTETYGGVSYVVGRYDSNNSGSVSNENYASHTVADAAAFALRVDPTTGVLSLVQYVSLLQTDTLSNNEGVFLHTGTLSAVVTVTDGDGDTATQSADISANIRFDDDGPVALSGTFNAGEVYEDGLTLANSNGQNVGNPETDHIATQVTIHATDLAQLVNFGADGPGSFGLNTAAEGTSSGLTSDGSAISYHFSGGILSGVTADGRTIFTLGADGSGGYTFTLLSNIDHGGSGDTGNRSLSLASLFTATDGDGDSVVLSGGVNVVIENDVPVVSTRPNLIVNGSFEEGHGDLQAGQWSIYHTLSGTWTSADTGNGNVPFEVQVNNTNGSGPGGVPAQNGSALIELDSDASSGNLSGDEHVNGTGHTNSIIQQVIAGTEAGQTYELTFWYAPRPGEGDADSGSMNVLWNGDVVKAIDSTGMTPGAWQQITVFVEGTDTVGGDVLAFQADGQENSLGAFIDNVSLVAAVVVDEDGLTGPNAFGNNDSQPGDVVVPNDDHAPAAGGDNNEATATGLLDIKWGADSADSGTDTSDSTVGSFGTLHQDHPDGVGDRSVTFGANPLAASSGTLTSGALTSHGDAVSFSFNADHTILTGTAGTGNDARTVFEVSLSDDGSGSFRFILKDALDHASGQNENNITLSFNYTATDADGDSAAGTFSVVVNDDMPVAKDDTDAVAATGLHTLTFDDIALTDGQEQPLPTNYDTFNITQGGVYNPGAGTYAPHSGANLAFIGEKNGSSVDGYAGNPGDPITIRHVDGTNFTAVGAWFSSNSTDPLTLLFTAYNDNNQVIRSFSQDIHTGPGGGPTYVDMSSLGSVDHIAIDSPTGANGHYFGFDDFTYVDNASASGNVITGVGTTGGAVGADALGADGGHVTAVSFGANAAVTAADANGNLTVLGAYGALIINADGTYTYTRDAGSPGGHNDVFTYTLTDGDGDTSQATLTVTIGDSTPHIGANTPDAGGDTAQVYEAGLAATTVDRADESAGSHVGDGAYPTTAGGTIAFTSLDGVGAVKLNGTALSSDSTHPTVIADGTTGSLSAWYSYSTVTGAGTIHYGYTILDNTLADPSPRTFTVAVTDADGDAATPAGTLTINIVNDVPTAHVDTDSANENTTLSSDATTNVLHNDISGADGFAANAVIGVRAEGGDATTPVTTGIDNAINGAYGDLTLHADGSYTYAAHNVGANETDTFVYTIVDGDGDWSTTTLTIDVANVNQPLSITGAITGTVYEDALPNANVDPGSSPVDHVNGNVTDTLSISGDEGTLSFSFAALGGSPQQVGTTDSAHPLLTSGGHPVYFGMLNGDLIGYANADGSAVYGGGSSVVFTVTLDHDTGAYQFTLNIPIDQPINPTADTLGIDLDGRIQVTDTGDINDTKPVDFSVNVVDDTPIGADDSAAAPEGQKASVNIVLVIDTSGSMGDDAGNGQSRLALAKAAAIDLLTNSSVDFHNVMVVSFASSASINTEGSSNTVWTSTADAISYINGLSANGNTNYNAAANKVEDNWGAGPGTADQTLVYFITDGQPTSGDGLTGQRQTDWENFLHDNGVDTSYAIGINTTVGDNDLAPIAWAEGNPGFSPIILTSASDLNATLQSTIPGSASGNVLSNDHFGADGGHIFSITVDGHVYTYDASSNSIKEGAATFATATSTLSVDTLLGGHLTFHFTADGAGHAAGAYDYQSPANVAASTTETFHYVITDNDGDTAGADLKILVHDIPNVPPHVALNETGASATVSDDFSSDGYSGGTGWGSGHNWVEEHDSSGSASSGDITVTSGALTFSKNTDEDDAVSRHVDLSGKSSATVSFDYTVTNHHSDDITVQAWNNTTSTWDNIGTIDGSNNTANGHFSHSLSADQIGSNSGIRFVATDDFGGNQVITIDNVAINYTTVIASDNHTGSFTEDGAAVAIAAASLITDSDDSAMSSAKIILTNEHTGDYLAINGTQLHDGSTGNINGIGYTVSDTGSAITVNLTGNDSLGDYQTAINAVTYGSNSQDPSEVNRTVDVTVTDAHGNISNTAETTITVHAVNDAPTLTAASNNATFTEGSGVGAQGAAVSVFKNAVVDTVENGQTITELDFTVSGLKDGANETIKVDGSTVSLVSNSFGTTATDGMTYLVMVSGGVATVTLKSAAGISEAGAQALVNGIQYQNTNVDDPTGGNRTFTLTSVQDSGGTANGGHDTTSLSINATVGVTPIDDPTVITNGLHVISNNGSDAFTVPDAAFLNYVTDPDGSLTVSGTNDINNTLTVSHSNSNSWITINDDSNHPGGSFTFTVSDGTPPSVTSGAVTYQQDTNDSILDGTNGNDIIVAAANSTVQHTTIGFNAGGYDVGDKVSLIVDGTTYTYAVTAGHTSAEAVYDRLEDTHGHNLSGSNAGGLTWADNLSGNSVTLTGDLGETFAITSAITNSSGAGHTSQLAPSVTTTYDGLTLNGNGGDDYLIGSNGNDILFGGAGHDLLLGGDGDDKLHGDDGANVLSGGQGADTFFLATTATADTVLDYSFSEGDKIDLSALLDTNFGPASNPSDFVKLTQQGTDVHVQVDTNGPTGGANFVDVAILSHYGTSGAEIVNAVFAGQEHQLHVTT